MSRLPQRDDLTPREHEVLSLIRLGLTNEEIAARLEISVSGVKYHVSQILSKLGVATREEATALAEAPRRGASKARLRRWWAAWPLAAKAAGAALVVAGLGVLAWGAWETDEWSGDEIIVINPTFSPPPNGVVGAACGDSFPTATLRSGNRLQNGFVAETQWNEPGACSLSAHGFGEVVLQLEPLVVSRGSPLVLELSKSPTELSAGVWVPNLVSPTPLVRENSIEIYDQVNWLSSRNVSVASIAEQALDLTFEQLGEHVINVRASWPGGMRVFVFRVLVEE